MDFDNSSYNNINNIDSAEITFNRVFKSTKDISSNSFIDLNDCYSGDLALSNYYGLFSLKLPISQDLLAQANQNSSINKINTRTENNNIAANFSQNVQNTIQNIKVSMGNLIYNKSSNVSVDNKSGKIILSSGEVLVNPSKDTTVEVMNTIVNIKKKAIALISIINNNVCVRNLSDEAKDSIVVNHNGSKVGAVKYGSEMILTQNDDNIQDVMKLANIGRRNVKTNNINTGIVSTISEFSIPNLINQNKILSSMYHSNNKSIQKITDQIIKMAACIDFVDSNKVDYTKSH